MKRFTNREKKKMARKEVRRADKRQEAFTSAMRTEDKDRVREALLKKHVKRRAGRKKGAAGEHAQAV